MRWLYHITPIGKVRHGESFSPESLAAEGFVHTSFAHEVLESARRYFAPETQLELLKIDPRRLDAKIDLANTPRGPMPHVLGAITYDAIREVIALPKSPGDRSSIDLADQVTGARVAAVAFAGMTLLDLVGLVDPISRIGSMGFDPTFTLDIVRATDAVVWSDHRASLEIGTIRPALDGYDLLLLPGGLGTRTLLQDRNVIDWLSTFPANRMTATVCTGSLLLGAMGRLRGKCAATHASARSQLESFGANVSTARVVVDGRIITGGGVTCALDVGLRVVEELEGTEVAQKIAAQMEFPWSSDE